MRKISVAESAKLSSPHLFALALSKDLNGKINIMGLSWLTFASFNPGKILISISQKSYTNENIKNTGFFTLCLALEEIKNEAFKCCLSSGRKNDKLKETGLELLEIEGFKVPAVKKCSVAWSLEVTDTIEAGDHTVFISDIKETVLVNDEKHLLAFDGYKRLDTV